MDRATDATPVRTSAAHAAELERIANVYDRRAAMGVAARYSYSDHGNLFLIQSRERVFLKELQRAELWPLGTSDIVDLGCGGGFWLRQFIQWGASPERLTGIDLLPDHVAEARRRCPASTRIVLGDATCTPLPAASFDLVFQSTVFTSILAADSRGALAVEMMRLVRPGGCILSYDFRYNNPNNPDVARLTASQLAALFPGCDISIQSLTLAPFVARTVGRWSHLACEALDVLPFLRTHLLATIRTQRRQ